jgi:hypothetical protein
MLWPWRYSNTNTTHCHTAMLSYTYAFSPTFRSHDQAHAHSHLTALPLSHFHFQFPQLYTFQSSSPSLDPTPTTSSVLSHYLTNWLNPMPMPITSDISCLWGVQIIMVAHLAYKHVNNTYCKEIIGQMQRHFQQYLKNKAVQTNICNIRFEFLTAVLLPVCKTYSHSQARIGN